MPRLLAGTALLTLALAAGTWLLGWWAVPVLAAAWGWSRGGPGVAALAAAFGWGGLLLTLPLDSLGRLLARLVGVFHLPGALLVLLALSYAALLAWSAAWLARDLRGAAR